MDWQNIQLEAVAHQVEPEDASRIVIPWEKIDEWIDSISFEDGDDSGSEVLDPGDRRN